jgi:hypothetical protein
MSADSNEILHSQTLAFQAYCLPDIIGEVDRHLNRMRPESSGKPTREQFHVAAEMLGSILRWIAGQPQNHLARQQLTRGILQRVVAAVFVVRPDLVERFGRTIPGLAHRFGWRKQVLSRTIVRFRDSMGDFKCRGGRTKASREKFRLAMIASHKRRTG